MFEIFTNPYLFVWLGIFLLFQNLLRAFPEPDPEIKTGFGSTSPGYRFLYKFTVGLKGDITAIGLDPKKLTQGMVKHKE